MGTRARLIAFVNTSPLIFLAQVGQIYLLKELFLDIITSKIVVDELKKKPDAPEMAKIEEALSSWIKIEKLMNIKDFKSLMATKAIHQGEASLIALALEYQEKANGD